jgi:hypothetical protein
VAINLVRDWPSPGKQLYAWSHLPIGTKVVTYSYRGKNRAWVVPIHDTAVFLVPRPAAFDGSYAVWHRAPFPVMKAFNAEGHLIAEENAPRVAQDNVPHVR